MSGSPSTVNDLMLFLRERFHVDAPILPLRGVAAALTSVWNMVVGWWPGKQPFPWKIPVRGTWDVLLPTGRSLPLTVSIVVEIDDVASP
jgi:hypothetical protein